MARVRSVIVGLQRGLSAARRRGPRGTLTAAVERVRPRVWLEEQHVWYQLDLAVGAAPDLGALELVTPRADELAAFDTLPTINAVQAAERVRQGGRPFLVLDHGQPLFACWIFTDRAPMLAARGGWLALPEQAACLEDSVAAPAARGRGIAPLTWRALADRLAHEDKRAMITKVATDNAPSRRAVAKAGFREIAVMRLWRCGILYRVEVEVLDPDSLGGVLRERLRRAGF